jgi:methyl-accepting chemotaxis protein
MSSDVFVSTASEVLRDIDPLNYWHEKALEINQEVEYMLAGSQHIFQVFHNNPDVSSQYLAEYVKITKSQSDFLSHTLDQISPNINALNAYIQQNADDTELVSRFNQIATSVDVFLDSYLPRCREMLDAQTGYFTEEMNQKIWKLRHEDPYRSIDDLLTCSVVLISVAVLARRHVVG